MRTGQGGSQALSVGPSTAQSFATILQSKPHPEMGYRSCPGILRLGQRHSTERVKAATGRALAIGACSYQSVKWMLQRGLDRQLSEAPAFRPPLADDYWRGAA
jgi:hypothetical protein